jgi:hypothetical protein
MHNVGTTDHRVVEIGFTYRWRQSKGTAESDGGVLARLSGIASGIKDKALWPVRMPLLLH